MKSTIITLATLICIIFVSVPVDSFAKAKVIFGKISNMENGAPLANVKVKIENSGFVAKSDEKGEFNCKGSINPIFSNATRHAIVRQNFR